MKHRVSMADFMSDEQGKQFSDVFADKINSAALEAALEIMNEPATNQRMLDFADRLGVAPLAGCFREIERNETFRKARNRDLKVPDRLKQAIGVACRLVMAEHGFVPAFYKKGNRPAVDRMKPLGSEQFTTARRYRDSKKP